MQPVSPPKASPALPPKPSPLNTVLPTVAETLVQTFYTALHKDRNTLSTFYLPLTTLSDGKTLPSIVINGNVLSSPAALQDLFVHQMPPMQYDAQAFDAQVVNPNFAADGDGAHPPASGRNMTVLVIVSGNVKVGERKDLELRGFSESFVLVANPEAGKRGRGKREREWLIESQNFRFVV